MPMIVVRYLCAAIVLAGVVAVIGGVAFAYGDLSVLPYVAAFGHPDVLFALIGAGAGLHRAVKDGDIAEVKRLINGGAYVNAKGNGGWMPVHYAAYYGQTEVALALVRAGADIEAKSDGGGTPLHSAAVTGQTETVLALAKAGADIEAKNINGMTPLQVAEKYGKTETARVLAKAAADIKAKSDDSGKHSRLAVAQPAAQGIKTGGDFRISNPGHIRTTDGHLVRSKAEAMIANYLFNAGIKYIYERKLPVKEYVICDFYLPGKKVYIEYWGLEGDPEYDKRKRKKLAVYKKHAFNLIQLHDREVQNLDYHMSRLLLKFGITVD